MTTPAQIADRDDQELEALLNELTKPIFIWRMAIGKLGNARGPELEMDSPLQKSARTSRANALREMRELIDDYAEKRMG